MTTILLLSGNSMGDALAATARSFRGMFESLSYDFVEIKLGEPNAIELLNREIARGRIEFAFSHMGMCADLPGTTSDGRDVNLWTGLGIPFISLYGDSPAYFFDRHIVPGNSFGCLYGFPEHYQLRKRLPKRNGLIGLAPPHLLDETPKHDLDFSRKERGALLFLKNGNDPDKLLTVWRERLSPDIFEMITELASDLARELGSSHGCDIDGVVCAYFRDRGLDVEELTALRLFFIAQLDDYLRRLKSTFIAESLLDFPIVVHGYNWEHLDFTGRRARYVYGGDYGKSKDLIRDALGIIDMSPNTTQAPHERPLRAFGMHTLCLTNEQNFFQRHFPQYASFSFRFDKESLQSLIADVLAHPRRYVELGVDAAATFDKAFDSAKFARCMLDTASCLRLASGPRPNSMQDFFVWPPTKLAS